MRTLFRNTGCSVTVVILSEFSRTWVHGGVLFLANWSEWMELNTASWWVQFYWKPVCSLIQIVCVAVKGNRKSGSFTSTCMRAGLSWQTAGCVAALWQEAESPPQLHSSVCLSWVSVTPRSLLVSFKPFLRNHCSTSERPYIHVLYTSWFKVENTPQTNRRGQRWTSNSQVQRREMLWRIRC